MKKTYIVSMLAALAFGLASTAGAQTVADLQAQLNALLAQLSALQGNSGAGVVNAISSDLTVGSSGNSVVVLQNALIAQGHLTMPAGVAKGFFGSLTKAAVMKWQAANGVSATGYFGPISRGKFNGSVGASGNVSGSTINNGKISTPGVEGTLTVSENPSPASGTKVYEGSTRVGVLGIKLEAKTSDIKIERVKLDLDCVTSCVGDSDVYRKIAQKIYIMDGSTVIGSADLNIDTVVEDGSERFITISGLNYVVPKDATRVLTVALDARSNWDSAFDADTFSVGVPVEGIRGVDGAGVNQYGPATAFLNEFTAQGELADSATLTISTNSGTVQDSVVIAADGSSENEKDGVELLKADFRAEKDAVTITDLVVDITSTGTGTATATIAYLYDGSTMIDSASLASGGAGYTFDDIDYTIPRDTTKTLTLKVDIDSANGTAVVMTADIDTADVTSENSNGTAVTESGSAQGESVTVRNVGLEYTLLSKVIIRNPGLAISTGTSTAQADFVVRIKAVGSAIEIGDSASTTYAFVGSFPSAAAGTSTVIYRGGSAVSGAAFVDNLTFVASSTSITVPQGISAAGGANSWVLGEGNSVDIPITYLFENRTRNQGTTTNQFITPGAYAVSLERFNWLSSATGRQSDTFMATNSSWRTDNITLP